MHTWIDVPVAAESTTPPVDDLLRVYLAQSAGSRAPEPDFDSPAFDAQDLWDYLGDFA